MRIGTIGTESDTKKRVIFLDSSKWPLMIIEYTFDLETQKLIKIKKLPQLTEQMFCNLPEDLDLSICLSEDLIGKHRSEIQSLLETLDVIYRDV